MVRLIGPSMVLVVLLALGATACERPPVGGPGPAPAEGRATVDLPRFLQDRPAIGGKWYEYSVDGHVLEPKSEAWILETSAGEHVAFRITSIYDDATGDSGVFHFDVAPRLGDAWGDTVVVVAGGNVKEGNTCLDLVAAAAGDTADRACDGPEAWHLRLVSQSRLSVFAGIAVAEPAIFLHDGVRVARFDGVALTNLPAPATIAVLDESPRFESTDWQFDRFATDLPEAGQALGALPRIVDNTWWAYTSAFRLARFTVSETDANTWRFAVAVHAVETADQTVSADDVADVEGVGAAIDVDVDVSTLPVYLGFRDEGLVVVDGAEVGPVRPGNTRRWDLAIVGDPLRVLVSPATAVINGTALDADPPFVP
jgi:hypothetical protein